MPECLYCGTDSITNTLADKSPAALLHLNPPLHIRQRKDGENKNPLIQLQCCQRYACKSCLQSLGVRLETLVSHNSNIRSFAAERSDDVVSSLPHAPPSLRLLLRCLLNRTKTINAEGFFNRPFLTDQDGVPVRCSGCCVRVDVTKEGPTKTKKTKKTKPTVAGSSKQGERFFFFFFEKFR